MTTNITSDDEYVLSYFEMIFDELQHAEHGAELYMIALQEIDPRGDRALSRRYKDQGREDGAARLYADYFADSPTYFDEDFRRHFRMHRSLFNRILFEVQSHNPYFIQQPDATRRLGLTGHQKMTAALRMLAYGSPADVIDEYVRIGESTVIESLGKFCITIYHLFASRYLRTPTTEDIANLSQHNGARGFPGCLGSVDCMHWEWKNRPTGWQGQFTGQVPKPNIILEVVASYDTWIWHASFGMSDSCNDLNILQKSHLFQNLLKGQAPPTDFIVNDRKYHMGYYLGNGIYPELATIVKAFREPYSQKKVKFTQQQQGCRKEVERAFGILQARWRIVADPSRLLNPTMLHLVMMTCIILHNMIVEDELRNPELDHDYDQRGNIPLVEPEHGLINETYREMRRKITDKTTYYQLRNDLVEHQWTMRGLGLLPP